MSKEKEVRAPQVAAAAKRFGKEAFLRAADAKDRMVYLVILEDSKTYTREEAEGLLHEWKSQEVKA